MGASGKLQDLENPEIIDENTSVRELILRSTRRVIERAQNVQLNSERIADFAKRAEKDLNRPPAWDKVRHFSDGEEQTAQWIFVLDSLNFSFWAEEGLPRWKILWQGEDVKGYWALACSLNLAMTKGLPITDAGCLERIDAKTLRNILDGSGDVPMIEQRAKVLNEIGAVLKDKYDGSFVHLLEEAGHSAENVVRLVANNFPCFNDVATYDGETVYLLKRAQILVSDLWGAFDAKDLGAFSDMHRLTAFADYKLPQVLRSAGILQYNADLARKVDSLELLAAGSHEEIEIRAATICAVEELVSRLAERGRKLPAFMVDWWLWDISHEEAHEDRPHHRTRTIFY